jgi:hypothetical protein
MQEKADVREAGWAISKVAEDGRNGLTVDDG